jgi:hypothetical protein
VEYHVVLVIADGYECSVKVADISAEGFSIEHEDDLRTGDEVVLRIGKGRELLARIHWALGNEAGGRFVDEL